MRIRTLDEQQRATLLDRLFRRIGKLDDESLLELEEITRVAETGGQPAELHRAYSTPAPEVAPAEVTLPRPERRPEVDPNRVSRRYFLAALVLGSLTAATAGGAASVVLNDDRVRGWLADQGWVPTATTNPAALTAATSGPTPTLPETPVPTLPPSVRNQLGAMENQVNSLTTERDGLSNQVNTLNTQVGTANNQISDLKTKNGDFQDLIDLYQQLELVNIDQIVTNALEAAGVSILAINTIRAALDDGIALTGSILHGIEQQMPLINAGFDWLEKEIDTLNAGIHAFQNALNVANSTSTAQDIANFISQLLDLLPFGVGENIKAALQALGAVLTALPDLLTNVNSTLIQPARVWITSDNQGGLYDLLLTPVRAQLLTPAQQIVANAQNLNAVYNTQVMQPVQAGLDQRAKVRTEIIKKAGTLIGSATP